jgi:hypothetical protein
MKRPDNVELARGYTVKRYRALAVAKDKAQIATLITKRFTERYLAPTLSQRNIKHGFTSMAVGCLMVEALESFRQGWPDTKDKSKAAFCSFFDAHPEFAAFRGHAEPFWKNVRCGILHQAETRAGWMIQRKGPLFDSKDLIVNATAFLRTLGKVLKSYRIRLKHADWDSDLWKNCRTKMKAICDNCA